MKKNSILINNKEDGDGKMLQNCQKTPKICHLSFVLYNIKVGFLLFTSLKENLRRWENPLKTLFVFRGL